MTNLKTEDQNGKIILAYINENASEALTEKINTGKKTMDGCMNYIKEEAKKQAVNGCACIEDKEVFGWAIHYFEEDSIKEGEVKKTTPAPEKKQETKPEKKKAEPKPKKVEKEEPQLEGQLNIFDLLGGGE